MAQYQHYIPQFLLRNFSHAYKPPKRKSSDSRVKIRSDKGKHRGEKVLNVVDLASNEPQLIETPVSRWFGHENMYKDVVDAITSKKDVEKELSKLESRTAEILQKVKKAHENGDPAIRMTRVERNLLRKFLFVMKYRGPGFHEKYFYEDSETYDSEDKNLLRAYMSDNGMKRPRDVWLHNLRIILDIDMDAEGSWINELPKRMFPADASMFIFHAQHSYVAFCTPAEKCAEFIMTDTCYNVFEGPSNETFCSKTGDYLGNTYLCYHDFAPISPQLIIVLRSGILPEALEDMNPDIQKRREKLHSAVATQFPNPEDVKSILFDLPVAKATNSYTRIINGRLELARGESGKPTSKDRFRFHFWQISTRHVDTINSIFLDNLLQCKSVVFCGTESFKRTLEAYMTTTSHGLKTIGVGEYRAPISRLACLEKLSAVLKALGCNSVPVWHNNAEKADKPFTQSLDDIWMEMTKKSLEDLDSFPLPPENTLFRQAYYILGGSKKTFVDDLDQAWRLCKLIAIVWNLTINCNDDLKQKARRNVLEFTLQIKPRRVWLYVKHQRWMLSQEYAMHQETYIGTAPIFAAKTKALFRAEQEDEIIISGQAIDDRRSLSGLMIGVALSLLIGL